MTLIGQNFWPPDELYADEEIREQWYLTGDWAPEGVNEDVHINWTPVAEDLEQRGHDNVVLGIIDDGIAWDAEDGLLHPDLKSARFQIGESYDGTINNASPHGTAVLSMMAADAENTDSLDNNEGDWGMTGVNTESDTIWIYKSVQGSIIDPDSIWFLQIAMETEAFKHMVRNKSPHIINYCSGFYQSQVRAEEDTLWEMAFLDLLAEERDMPLFVCAAGNSANHGVAFPARNAFTSNAENYEKGFPFVVSVSGISETGERYFSFENGHNYVSLVAPSGSNDLMILAAWDSRYYHQAGLPEEYEPWFFFWSGTSFATPLVAGVASLVLSQDWDVNEERTLDAWALRKIIEKTARDVNDTTNAYFDDEMGFGLVDCYATVTNRDLHSWQLDDNTWYYISSNVDPVYDTIPRVLEELTLDNDDYDNGLAVFKSYDPHSEVEYFFKPDSVDDGIDWGVQRMYQIRRNSDPDNYTDTLWICGKAQDMTDDIYLFDTDSTSGWNWAAYYPDYEASADEALTSIATSGDSDSDLYLAKGQSGTFYAVNAGFCNLTMKPGEGYQMQLDEDRNDTLNYPANDPDPGPPMRRKKDEGKFSDAPQHFTFTSRTGDFLPILVTGVEIADREPGIGDEIGVFIADTLCVGAGVWNGQLPIGFAAWRDDETVPELNGYRNLNSLTFRF